MCMWTCMCVRGELQQNRSNEKWSFQRKADWGKKEAKAALLSFSCIILFTKMNLAHLRKKFKRYGKIQGSFTQPSTQPLKCSRAFGLYPVQLSPLLSCVLVPSRSNSKVSTFILIWLLTPSRSSPPSSQQPQRIATLHSGPWRQMSVVH